MAYFPLECLHFVAPKRSHGMSRVLSGGVIDFKEKSKAYLACISCIACTEVLHLGRHRTVPAGPVELSKQLIVAEAPVTAGPQTLHNPPWRVD